jgi:hypothetical protein
MVEQVVISRQMIRSLAPIFATLSQSIRLIRLKEREIFHNIDQPSLIFQARFELADLRNSLAKDNDQFREFFLGIFRGDKQQTQFPEEDMFGLGD